VVYAHCNSGCRVEGTTSSHLGLQYLKYFIEKGWNVVLFDFSGSGLSEGDTISLGYQEARDLKLVVEEMQRAKGNRMFMLWGRSMGASTIIFYLSEFPDHASIIGCVLDSPYCCLWRLSL
jgi:pimeloyl-ACP methyl ester carboxylesterase